MRQAKRQQTGLTRDCEVRQCHAREPGILAPVIPPPTYWVVRGHGRTLHVTVEFVAGAGSLERVALEDREAVELVAILHGDESA